MLAVSLLVVSCSKKEVLTTSQPEDFAHIRVGVNDFTITEGEFPTRDGEPVIEYAGVKAIDLAFYEGRLRFTSTRKCVMTEAPTPRSARLSATCLLATILW